MNAVSEIYLSLPQSILAFFYSRSVRSVKLESINHLPPFSASSPSSSSNKASVKTWLV